MSEQEATQAVCLQDEKQAVCTGCGRRCPLSDPQCGIGFRQAEALGIATEGQGDAGAAAREGEGGHRPHHGHSGHGGQGHEGSCGHGGHGGRGGKGSKHAGGPHGHGPGHRASGRQGAEAPTEDERLSRVLHHCARTLVHRERHQGGRASVLAVLSHHAGMTQAQLAEKLGIRSASASELLGKMEADGLVERQPDSKDGRAWCVQLTDCGLEAAQQVHEERQQRDQQLFEALTAEEKEQLTDLLDKLATSWRGHHR